MASDVALCGGGMASDVALCGSGMASDVALFGRSIASDVLCDMTRIVAVAWQVMLHCVAAA